MIEKWCKFHDIGGHAGALLTDVSKAFDCIDHELLIAKLHAYGFDTDALNLFNLTIMEENRALNKFFI